MREARSVGAIIVADARSAQAHPRPHEGFHSQDGSGKRISMQISDEQGLASDGRTVVCVGLRVCRSSCQPASTIGTFDDA